MKRLAFPCLMVAALAFTACGDSYEPPDEETSILGPQLDAPASVLGPDSEATVPQGAVADRKLDRR